MKKESINVILKDYEKKRDKAIHEQKIKQTKIYKKIPRIKEIDDTISRTGLLISKTILNNPDSYEEKVYEIKNIMEELKKEKAILLTENNIPMEYLDIKYSCDKCQDTGFLKNGNKCSCFKQELINRAYKMSNISRVLERENFKTFDINLFSENPFEGEDISPRENMLQILSISEEFVFQFDDKHTENLFFYGTTGLGKTFMCNCIAKGLLDRGKIVIYQTAFKMMDIIRSHKFENNINSKSDDTEYNLLFDSDLLIIDDLGTENPTSFTNSEIFNIVNSRLIDNKKTVISTNLSPKEMAEIYTDRIFSRIFNNFRALRFYGKDLRWENKDMDI